MNLLFLSFFLIQGFLSKYIIYLYKLKGVQIFKKGDILIHCLTNSKVEVIEVLPKDFFCSQQVKCTCLNSSIKEDIGEIFEYDLDSLSKI